MNRVGLTVCGGRKEKRATCNNHNHMHHNVLGDVGMHYSLAVMFHVFPVMKRRENMAVMSIRITDIANIVGTCEKSWTHRLWWEEGGKGNI